MKLARFLKTAPPGPRPERCEFCSAEVGHEHGHVVDLDSRAILCACHPCHMVFRPEGAANGRYRPIPTRVVRLGGTLDEAWWRGLQIPVGLAFLFHNSRQRRVVAFYPSPAGPVEAALATRFWEDAVRENPILDRMEADVEALLIRRQGASELKTWLVPIDICYALTGVMRLHWRGFDGGEAGARLDEFFEELEGRAR
jgi:hypothetical protein